MSPKFHALLDYITVLAFAVAPTLLGLSGLAAMGAYILAGVHLLLTLMTRFPGGIFGAVPMRVHGFIELAVSLVLGVAPWALPGLLPDFRDKLFYSAAGAVIFFVWLLSDYRAVQQPEPGNALA